ncbi:MAG: PEP-CTERM sorting domain-containing protein [Deltaproteobacteria bacterium]|nr:PEP-CTERM sorting domain-containing protein [Deltaproteobacteria bacterium]
MAKKMLSGLGAAAIFVFGFSGAASATTLDFELGLIGGTYTSLNQLDASYGGFTWDSNYYVTTQDLYNVNYGNSSTFVSGNEAAFNGYGVLTVTATGSPVDLTGAWFQGWGAGDIAVWDTATSVTVEGFLGATSVGTASMSLSPSSFSYLSFNFGSPVDSFTVTSSGEGHWWLMDDLSYNAASVPEPSTLILLGSGMAGLGLMRLRRRK